MKKGKVNAAIKIIYDILGKRQGMGVVKYLDKFVKER